VRSIDWKVTARYSRPFIKEYTEERDQTFYFLIDISGSGSFGSGMTKQRKMLEVVASLAFAALRNNDRVGICLFSDKVEKFVPAKKGRKHVVTILNTLISYTAASKKTDLAVAVKFLATVLSRKSSVIILSDFVSEDFMRPLKILKRKHEVMAIRITDPREHELPDIGYIELEDPETGEQLLVNTSDQEFRERYQELVDESYRKLSEDLARTGIGVVPLATDEPYDLPLKQFFTGQKRRRAHGRIL
jgi:uncharacterized protein (DUF58 family)